MQNGQLGQRRKSSDHSSFIILHSALDVLDVQDFVLAHAAGGSHLGDIAR
jgi:hypothetical protein